MGARQAHFITSAVNCKVLLVVGSESRSKCLDVGFTARFPGVICRKIGMHAGAVPVTSNRFWIQVDDVTISFGCLVEKVARHHQVVARFLCAFAKALEFPLAEHDFRVDADNTYAGFQADIEVFFDEVTSRHIVITNRAIVRPLRLRKTALGETNRAAVVSLQDVLLFESEPEITFLLIVQQ